MFDSEKKAQAFSDYFVREYLRVGFGSISKRETEILFLEALQRADEGIANLPDFDLAVLLKTSDRRVRNLRNELSFRRSQDEEQLKARLREHLKRAETHMAEGRVRVEINDAALRAYAEHIVRASYGMIDRSFNSSIISMSGEKYMLLAVHVVSDVERKDIEKEIRIQLKKMGKKAPGDSPSLLRAFAVGVAGGAGEKVGSLMVSGGLAIATGGASLLLETGEIANKGVKTAADAIDWIADKFSRPKT